MAFGPHLLLATLEGLVTSAVLALTALGLSLVFGVMRVVNVAHGEFYMLGAVMAWWVASLCHRPSGAGLSRGIDRQSADRRRHRAGLRAAGAETARLQSGIDHRRDHRHALHFPAACAHLLRAGSAAREPPFNLRILLPWFGYSGYKLSIVAASALLLVVTWFVLTKDEIGLVMRATQYDSETAQAFGIPVERSMPPYSRWAPCWRRSPPC